MKTTTTPANLALWHQIEELITEEKYQSILKAIDPAVFKMVLNDNQRTQVTASILTMLQSREPEHATKEYAEKIVDLMKLVAQKIAK